MATSVRPSFTYSDLKDAATTGKRLWNSEYGEGDGTGLSLASNLNLDFQWLHNTAWVYWQVIDPASGWGLLVGDMDKKVVKSVNNKYFVRSSGFHRHAFDPPPHTHTPTHTLNNCNYNYNHGYKGRVHACAHHHHSHYLLFIPDIHYLEV